MSAKPSTSHSSEVSVEDFNSENPGGKTLKGSVSILPQEYIDAISFYARQAISQTLYPGHLFEDLASFLRRAPLPTRSVPTRPNERFAFGTLYTLDGSESQAVGIYNDVESCVQAAKQNLEASRPQILFLKGYPSPEWLASIGSLFRVDPEFFRWQLRFRCRREYFASPSLPSTFENILKLRFMTIGSREKKRGESDQASVDALRSKGTRALHQYEHDLMVNNGVNRGDSIVRSFSLLDEKNFFIEQEMSICLNFIGKTWTALICTDAGNDLSLGPRGPWLTDHDRNSSSPWTIFYPTIQHRTRVAFKSKAVLSEESENPERNFPQSVSLLSEGYGNFLDLQAMKADPFYALNELYRFSAFSYMQFLNMLEEKIGPEAGYSSLNRERPTLSNLLYFQEVLDNHIAYLQENVEVIRRRGHLDWPRVSGKNQHLHSKVMAAASSLQYDFEHLLQRATSLSQRCIRGTSIIMNNATLAESKQAIQQAKWIGKLTLIAFFYIPLSFTASFFGMNFKELGTQLSIWIWFVTSIPLFFITIAFGFWDMRGILSLGKRMMKRIGYVLS